MRKEFLAIIAGTIFLMAILYWNDNQLSVDRIQPTFQSIKNNDNTESAPQKNFYIANTSSADASQSAQAAPYDAAEREISTQFANTLKTIGRCLMIKNVVEYDQIDPTFDNLIVSLKPALGDITVYTDDWTQSDVQFSDGTQKRIRTEINYDNPGDPIKYLQVYKLTEMGVPEMEDLDPQHTMNPSDEYIGSLRIGSNTLLHEKGGRAYFQGGEEVVIIERNGLIESVTMTKNSKTVSCYSISTKESNCQCFGEQESVDD
jgi:hypothetical protein